MEAAECEAHGEVAQQAQRRGPRPADHGRAGRSCGLPIHFQADQQPSPAPSISSGAVHRTDRSRTVRSSQRPAKTPISMGTTTIQPSTPIWARRRATDSARRRWSQALVTRHRAGWTLLEQAVIFDGVWVRRRSSEGLGRRVSARLEMTHDLADGAQLQAGAVDPFGPVGLDHRRRNRPRTVLSSVAISSPTIASRVAMAISPCPGGDGQDAAPARRSRCRAPTCGPSSSPRRWRGWSGIRHGPGRMPKAPLASSPRRR